MKNNKIDIELDMRTKVILPISYGEQIIMTDVLGEPFYVLPKFDKEDEKAKYHIALKRGPIVLAQDSRFGYNIDEAVDIAVSDGCADAELSDAVWDAYSSSGVALVTFVLFVTFFVMFVVLFT